MQIRITPHATGAVLRWDDPGIIGLADKIAPDREAR